MYRNDNDSLVDTQLLNTLLVYDTINDGIRNYKYNPKPEKQITLLPNNQLFDCYGVKLEGWVINALNWSTSGWFFINPIKILLLFTTGLIYVLSFLNPKRRVG